MKLLKLSKKTVEGRFVKTDVSKVEDVKNLIDFTLKEYGEFNFAFNNSGLLGDVQPLAEQKPEDSSYIIDVNIKGVVYCMHYESSRNV